MGASPQDAGDTDEPRSRRSLGGLVASLPDLIARRIRGEIALVRADITARLKRAGKGLGLLAAAAVFGFLLLETLIAAAVLATATVLPAWLAALLIAAGLLVVTAVLGLLGRSALKKPTTDRSGKEPHDDARA